MVPSCKLPEESDASMRARLFTSLSQSFPHSQLYKALHGGEDINLNGGENSEDDDDSLYGDHLSNSCFASLRMDRRDSDDFDDDLRSLEWLQNEDLLKNIGGEKLDKEDDDNEEQKENEDIKPDINLLQAAVGQPPPHIPYLPQKHVNSKPPYSFSCLIFMAVEASPQKRLPVKDIYNWILTQFPYFQNAPTGWKNSVRHNLSLNKCFKKVEKDKGQSIGKGSLWCIDPAYRPNLLQALRKTPYHPYHQLQMTSTQPQNYMQYQSLPGGGRTVLPLTQRPVPNTVSPHLFPFLSRRLAQTSFDVDNEMKDVAQTLVALKGSYKKEPSDNSPGEDTGPTWRNHKRSFKRSSSPVVVTGHPYDDHAYSSTRLLDDDVPSPSSSSSIDEEYDFGDADEECESDYQSDMEWDSDSKDEVDGDLPSSKKLKIDIREDAGSSSHTNKGAATSNESEDDEQKKIHEGASALLNLAGLLMSSRGSGSKPEAGGARKKKATTGDKDKKGEKKKRVVKQQKNVVKKSSTSASQKEEATVEEKSQRKRSVSKRKNAGSNGKYDSDEYSVSLPGKSAAKSRSSSSSSPKSTKTKVARSSSSKESVESGTTLKTKTSVKGGSSTKIIKKGSIGKKKLKLSKSFGTMKKHASVISDKNNLGVDGTKLKKIATKKVQRKAHYAKKDLPRNKGSSIPRKSKSNSEESDVTKSASQSQMSSDNSKPAESTDKVNNNNNNNNVVKDEGMSIGEEKPTAVHEEQVVNNVDPSKAESKKIGDEQLGKTTTTLVNGEIISPAGDAPACPLETQALAADDKSEKLVESKASVQSSPTTSNSNSSSGDAKESSDKVLGAKISPNSKSSSSSLASTPAAVSSHKSPHFTRFSKKKAAIS